MSLFLAGTIDILFHFDSCVRPGSSAIFFFATPSDEKLPPRFASNIYLVFILFPSALRCSKVSCDGKVVHTLRHFEGFVGEKTGVRNDLHSKDCNCYKIFRIISIQPHGFQYQEDKVEKMRVVFESTVKHH